MSRILQNWPWAAFLASAAMLAIAHAFQTFGHLSPCELCLKEREVYWAALAVAAAGVAGAFTPLNARWTRLISLILALVFLGGCALAIYHAGAEWKFWPGPATCSGGAGRVNAADLASLLTAKTMVMPACDKPAWVFLGVSMAGWNAVVSLGLAIASGLAAVRRRAA